MGRRPYPWPASLLDAGTMRRLLAHRQRTGEAMTKAIRRGVIDLLAVSEADAARTKLRVAEGDSEQAGVAQQSWKLSVATTAHGEQRSTSA